MLKTHSDHINTPTQIDHHLNTCTTHSGAKKANDWTVDPDPFHTTHEVKTQQVIKSQGPRVIIVGTSS
jgi:hypothetical protein